MASFPRALRLPAVGAPALLLLTGVLRLVDRFGWARGVGSGLGRASALLALALLGALVVGLRKGLGAGRRGFGADAGAAAGVLGALCLLWDVLGGLATGLRPPGAVGVLGAVPLPVGLLVLLLISAGARRLPDWSPPLVLAALLLPAGDPDLLAAGALLLLAGLAPVGRAAAGAGERARAERPVDDRADEERTGDDQRGVERPNPPADRPH
ncbi:hypothetical protein [Streptomyces sp. NPDC050560]|uniref:hypothetical protein n=1 Tax=Streptomyces sp. NPDC050560 TaxID=3365630 RepID=UPI0037B280FC